jgi:hypothetical protein
MTSLSNNTSPGEFVMTHHQRTEIEYTFLIMLFLMLPLLWFLR